MVKVDGQSISLTLEECRPSRYSRGAGPSDQHRQPFSLKLSGPDHAVLEQGSYSITFAGLGKLDLFLVPIDPGIYEIIFG